MKIVYILFVLVLSACGQSSTDNGSPMPKRGVNPNLSHYVQNFENLYQANINFGVNFDDGTYTGPQGNSTVVGVCRIWSNGSREILIYEPWWNNQSDEARQVLIFHELGHCYLNRNHDTTMRQDGMPLSIMYPIINPIVSFYNRDSSYQDYYHAELNSESNTHQLLNDLNATSMHAHDENGNCIQFVD